MSPAVFSGTGGRVGIAEDGDFLNNMLSANGLVRVRLDFTGLFLESTNRMTLTELRYIVAVARERHFGHAALACFVSQPTLSVGIKKIEEELGVTIFERGSNEITITPVGAQIIAQAERTLDEAATIKTIAQESGDPWGIRFVSAPSTPSAPICCR
ncbi:hydrogen peroxide-inducible protein activator [mine drainage metagenome]|uniref:Hydrogen peroxide-inducible protein activator n=1 Tax=mine drainage metagenome TaxID=410659 RepID=A0A1J5QD67_9ZZZZ